jgi:hypothetical protein
MLTILDILAFYVERITEWEPKFGCLYFFAGAKCSGWGGKENAGVKRGRVVWQRCEDFAWQRWTLLYCNGDFFSYENNGCFYLSDLYSCSSSLSLHTSPHSV